MAEPEALNTMFQNAFEKVGDGDYALKTSGSGAGGTPTTVSFDQTDPNNKVRIADGQVITVDQSLESRQTSVTANGKATTPILADTAIATTANLAAGTWDIKVTAFMWGTTAPDPDVDNLQFHIGVTPVATIISPVPDTGEVLVPVYFEIRVDVDAPTPVSVVAANDATVGANYAANIIATRWAGV